MIGAVVTSKAEVAAVPRRKSLSINSGTSDSGT